MDIVKELKEFKQNKAKLEAYRMELYALENNIYREIVKENKNEVIEGMALRKSLDNTITTNDAESKVERIAENYSKELRRQVTKDEARRNRIAQIKSLINFLELKINYIDKVILGCLDPKEKFVTEELLVNKMNWGNVRYSFNEFYRESMEIESLRTIKKTALKKIEKVIKETENCILWGVES